MNTIIKSKWICINSHYANKGITTVGKIYEFTKEVSICPITDIDLSVTSFIGDDNQSYLIHDNEQIDMSFISLEQYRQDQLNKIL